VTARVKRSSAQWTRWSTSFHESSDCDGQSTGPLLGERDLGDVLFLDVFKRALQNTTFFINRECNVTNHKVSFVFGFEREVIGQVSWATQRRHDLANPLGKLRELDFLYLQDEQSTLLAEL
jgi:hypothetical protein